MDHPLVSPSATASDIRSAGHVLSAALAQGIKLAALPGAAPATLEQAYAVQCVIAAAAGPVGGWKVSPLRADSAPRCSPIPRSFFREAPATFDPDVLASCQGELEIAVRLGADLLPRSGEIPVDEVAAAIATVHPAVELLSSRFAADSAAPDFHRLADLQNCAGVILGAGVAAWRDIEFAELPLELALDGQALQPVQAQPSTQQTLAAIGWLAAHAHQRGLPLKAGDIIITGARVGPVALTTTRTVMGRAGSLGHLAVSRR